LNRKISVLFGYFKKKAFIIISAQTPPSSSEAPTKNHTDKYDRG
jgi:hypothetical protein